MALETINKMKLDLSLKKEMYETLRKLNEESHEPNAKTNLDKINSELSKIDNDLSMLATGHLPRSSETKSVAKFLSFFARHKGPDQEVKEGTESKPSVTHQK